MKISEIKAKSVLSKLKAAFQGKEFPVEKCFKIILNK
jgi:hypothetical protein